MTDSLHCNGSKVGLRIRDEKTKLQLIRQHGDAVDVVLNGIPLECADHFTYLGSIQSNVGNETRTRIGKRLLYYND